MVACVLTTGLEPACLSTLASHASVYT